MTRLPSLTTVITLFASAMILLGTVAPALAQSSSADAVGLMAIPPRIGEDGSLVVKPGNTIQLEARVRNTSGAPVAIRSIAEDFIIGEDGITPVPVEELTSSRWSLAQWIQISTPVNNVAPGESVTVPFVIQVPTDAAPGGRYAMVMHQIEGAVGAGAGASTGGQAAINQRVGTLVYLRIEGPVTEDANIRNLQVPGLVEYGPVPITFEVENLSDIHIRPAPVVTITNWFGKEVDSFSADSQNVFPFSQRPFEMNWEHMWGFGRYTVDVEASYGTTGKVAVATATFWMIPYTIILGGLLLLIALIGITVAVRRYLYHRSDVTQKHISLLEEKIKHLENELPERK
jgi:hypothetical protein